MMKDFCVEFNLADSEYMTALRLVAGAVCALHDVALDDMEDFKVCVTESVIIMKNSGFESVRVSFSGESVECTVVGEGGTPAEGDCELSLALIAAMIESCDIHSRGGVISSITLRI